MKKRKTKKDLEIAIDNLSNKLISLEGRIASYNALFSMYVKYKDDSTNFQEYLKEELKEEKDAEIGKVKDKEVQE